MITIIAPTPILAPFTMERTVQTKSTTRLIMLNTRFLTKAFLPFEKREEIITASEKMIIQTIVINGNKNENETEIIDADGMEKLQRAVALKKLPDKICVKKLKEINEYEE